MVNEILSIRAIKDWCNDAMTHERNIRTFQALARPVSVLTTHSSWLIASLSMGANGLLFGAGSVIADLQVTLFRAVQAKDLKGAQALNDRIYLVVQKFYRPPFLDMHNRMKECLVLLGRLERAIVRPPLVKLTEREIGELRIALDEAGITREGALSEAAD
jgi:4-hydroxy-tetrahydrodipicolinate synthase